MPPSENNITETPVSQDISDDGSHTSEEAVYEVLQDLRHAMMEKWITRDRFIRFLDRDCTGAVSYEEFMDVVEQFGLKKTEEKVDFKEVFNVLDKEKTGRIPIEAFMEAMTVSEEDFDYEDDIDVNNLPAFESDLLVGLVAHNNMKPSMMKFVKENLAFFSRVKLVTTGSTGRALSSLGLEVEHKVSSGPLGGDQEIGSLISQGKVCAVFFFTDPLSAHAHTADIEALNRICNVHDIFIASNPSTAKCVVHALEYSTFGFSRLTGLNVAEASEVVKKYKADQEKVINAVSKRQSSRDRRRSSRRSRAASKSGGMAASVAMMMKDMGPALKRDSDVNIVQPAAKRARRSITFNDDNGMLW